MEIFKDKKIYIRGSSGVLLVWGIGSFNHMDDVLERTKDFQGILVVYQESNWDDAFSPWECDVDDRHFGGQARDTLDWVEDLIVYMKERYEISKVYLAGYSLSALFVLWSAYESNALDGVISCSATLWFPGWDEYVSKKHCRIPVYLSLGGKEDKVKHPLMKTIGDCTKRQYELLKKDQVECYLVMNKGGHFADEIKRINLGIEKLICK